MFGYLPQNLLTGHLGQNTSGLSPRVWSKLVGGAMAPDGDKRLILAGDDFTSFGGTVTSNVGTYSSQGGGYKSYEDTGDSIAQLATAKGGVIKLLTDTTDNDEVWLQSGHSQGVLGAISDTAGADHLTVFECRVAVGQITDTYNMFVGLGEEGLAAADTITDGGALASKDLIGFQILEADGDSIDFVYRKAGGAAVQKIAALQVPVADTFYKLGFVYDPTAPSSKRIAVYVDNVENSTYVTATNIATATFPDGEELAFLMGLKNDAAAAKNASIDWWAYGQGWGTVVDPIKWMGKWGAASVASAFGKPVQADEAIELFKEMGGEMVLTRVGWDFDSMRRARRQLQGQGKGVKTRAWIWGTNSVSSGRGLAEAAKDVEQWAREVSNWSDAGPRLTEFVATLNHYGYELRQDGKLYNTNSGQQERPPRDVLVKAINAAAEATYNYKRIGSKMIVVDAVIPFVNATIEPQDKMIRTLKNLRKLGEKDDQGNETLEARQARRTAVYIAAAVAAGAMTWLLRRDDDDWKEMEPWQKWGYWTWGTNGQTVLRFGRSREWGVLTSMTEAVLEDAFGDTPSSEVLDVLGHETRERIPDLAGVSRATKDVLQGWDKFRNQPLVPGHLQNKPERLQYTERTLWLSKQFAKVTASDDTRGGLGPMEVEHILSQATGGAYTRLGETAEGLLGQRKLGAKSVPFVRGVVRPMVQRRSIAEFYEVRRRTANQWDMEVEEFGTASPETAALRSTLDDTAAIMTEIRNLERDGKGERDFKYERYLVGLARDALNESPLQSYPSPLDDPTDLPPEIRSLLVRYATNRVKAVALSHGMPTKVHREDKDFADTLAKWRKSRDADAQWLRAHKKSPIVQAAINDVRRSRAFIDLTTGRGYPKFGNYDDMEAYSRNWRRWMERR